MDIFGAKCVANYFQFNLVGQQVATRIIIYLLMMILRCYVGHWRAFCNLLDNKLYQLQYLWLNWLKIRKHYSAQTLLKFTRMVIKQHLEGDSYANKLLWDQHLCNASEHITCITEKLWQLEKWVWSKNNSSIVSCNRGHYIKKFSTQNDKVTDLL